jgi:AcrR family transcriptional regulator
MSESTSQRILDTTLQLLMEQGIRKTSMDEVAERAGVTRVTIYRYFRDKRELVREVFLRMAEGIESVNLIFADGRPRDIGAYLDALGAHFRTLPHDNLVIRHEELSRVYPDVWAEFQKRRKAAIHKTFGIMLEVADSQGLVRDNLHRRVVEAYFQAAVINVMEHPALVSLNLSLGEIYSTASSIFMHGILKDRAADEATTARC